MDLYHLTVTLAPILLKEHDDMLYASGQFWSNIYASHSGLLTIINVNVHAFDTFYQGL